MVGPLDLVPSVTIDSLFSPEGTELLGWLRTWKNPKGGFLELTPESGRAGRGVHKGVSASLWDLCRLSASIASEFLKPEMECWP